MKQHTPNAARHDSNPRLRLISVPVLLSFALAAGACSSNGITAPETTTTAAPTSTPITGAPPTSTPTSTAPDTVVGNTASTDTSLAPESTTPPISTQTDQPDADSQTDADGERADADIVADFFAELDAENFTGTVMATTPDGVWSAGFGAADRSAGVDNDVDTVYDIGSLTKQFTAAAIVRLEMDGLLSVDDNIGQYVDGLTAEQSEITLHQLLTHTSGVPHGLGPDDEAIGLADYIERVANSEFPASPVGEYAYSNVGYSLLGAVVEAVTGGSYEAYLRDALFLPAGMLHTGYVLADWTDATIAVGYVGDEVFGRPNEQPWAVDGPGWNLRANGGLLSTMPDLHRWDAALRADEILDADAKAKLIAPHVEVAGGDGARSGYGWNVVPLDDGTALVTHAGGNGVFFADFYRFVDHGITISIASNVADPLAFDVGGGLASMLLPDLFADGVCELDPTPVDAAAGFDLVADFPDTPAGHAMAAWVGLVLSDSSSDADDRSMLVDYVKQSIGDGFIDELGSETVADMITSLQDTLDGFDLDRIHQEDDTTFHVVVADPDGNDAVISTRLDATSHPRVDCIGVFV